MAPSLIELADDIAERVLFAAALQTDEADIVPQARFDVLARRGCTVWQDQPSMAALASTSGRQVVARLLERGNIGL